MNKGFKVLSSVLAMSMVLASGVFAYDFSLKTYTKDESEILKSWLAPLRKVKVVTKEEGVLYKELVDPAFLADLANYEKVLEKVERDADVVKALGDARCAAQFDLDYANNQIMATRKLIELADGIGNIGEEEYVVKSATYQKPSKDGESGSYIKKDLDYLVIGENDYFFAKELTELKKLIAENKRLSKIPEAELLKKDSTFFVEGDKTYGQMLIDNAKAIEDLLDKADKAPYQTLLAKLKSNYGATDELSAEQVADKTVSALYTKAKKAAAKIRLLNDFAEKHKFTLRECLLAQGSTQVNPKDAKKDSKKDSKKDDVPNTASYFPIYVPACMIAVPPVKYYGAANVYHNALYRPYVCEETVVEVIEVPKYTFDEITAYDVACCCCK